MQLSLMRAKLRRIIGNPTTTAVVNSRLDELLNQAHRDIGDRYRFHKVRSIATFPTVDGTKRYTLPTDLSVLMRVWNQTERTRIRKRKPEDITEIDAQDTDVEGKPTHYLRFRDWIELVPIPDAVYTISLFYKTSVVDMVADSDTPLLPTPWHIGVVYYARWIYFDEEGAIDKAEYALDVWEHWIAQKPVEVDEEKEDLNVAVSIPTLDPARWRNSSGNTNLDFDHSDE